MAGKRNHCCQEDKEQTPEQYEQSDVGGTAKISINGPPVSEAEDIQRSRQNLEQGKEEKEAPSSSKSWCYNLWQFRNSTSNHSCRHCYSN